MVRTNMKNLRPASIAIAAAVLMLLSGVPHVAATHITLSSTASVSQPVGIDYNPTSGNLIVSSGWPGGSTLRNLDPNTGAVTPFTTGTFGAFELKIAVSKEACAFPAGEVFVGNAGGLGTIGFFTATGAPINIMPLPTVTSTTGFEFEDMGLACDTTGTQFGGDLIVVTNDGRVFRINTSYSQTLVTNLNVFLEGLTVAPT
jgi:DNA-binding beta-propeller fold protein YncE